MFWAKGPNNQQKHMRWVNGHKHQIHALGQRTYKSQKCFGPKGLKLKKRALGQGATKIENDAWGQQA